MKVGRWKSSLAAAMATTMLATMTAYPLTAMAQWAKGIMMYEDTKTGAFYSKPGKIKSPWEAHSWHRGGCSADCSGQGVSGGPRRRTARRVHAESDHAAAEE